MLHTLPGPAMPTPLARRMLPAATSLVALLVAMPAWAQAPNIPAPNDWTGAVDSNFNTPGNWSLGTPTGNVLIDYRTNRPRVNDAASVGSLDANGDLTVTATGALVARSITVGAGTLDNSGVIQSGQIIQNGSILTNQASGRIEGGVSVLPNGLLTNNAGTITGGVTIAERGLATNDRGLIQGGVVNAGTFMGTGQIHGDITNQGNGNLFSRGGTLTGNGKLTNTGAATAVIGGAVTGLTNVINTSTAANGLIVNPGGVLSAGGVSNAAGSGVFVRGTLSSASAVENAGTLTTLDGGIVNGGVTNSGTVRNVGTINGGLTNTGVVDNIGAGILNGPVVTSGSFTNAAVVNGPVTITDGLFDNTGRLKDSVTVINGQLVSLAPGSTIESGLINSARADVAGVLTGPIDNRAGGRLTIAGATHGDGVVQNQSGATLALTGGDFTGLNRIDNAGSVVVAGDRTLGTAGFNNLATGSISTQNGATGDSLTINGPYAGSAGSRIAVDVDLSKTAGIPADRITVNGPASGATTLAITNIGPSSGMLAAPVEVLSVGAGSTLSVNRGRVASAPYVNYTLDESAPGSGRYQISSQFNSVSLSSITSGLAAGLTSLSASLHQPLNPVISRPVGCAPNEFVTSPFIRMMAGSEKVGTKTTAELGTASDIASNRVANRTGGFHAGLDFGICNVGGSLWTLSLGLSGGLLTSSATATSDLAGLAGSSSAANTGAKLDMPFFAMHVLASHGGFNAEVAVRRDSIGASVTTTGDGVNYANAKVNGRGWSVNAQTSYRFMMPSAFYLEPHLGVTRGSVSFSTLQLATGSTDTLAFSRVSTGHFRAGINLGTSLRLGDSGIISPFAHFSLWSSLGSALVARATLDSLGETATVRSASDGSFSQVGAGLLFRSVGGGVSGFVRGDVRFGGKLSGQAFNAGVRLTF